MAYINGKEILFSAGLGGTSGGEGGGGNAEFNIAYGETEPTDTSKLWIKTSEPEAVKVTSNIVVENEKFDFGISALPTQTYDIASAVIGTKVYLFGGQNGSTTYYNTINVFDTESNTITTLETTLPTNASGIASAVVGTKVYLFGGQNGSTTYYNTINVFDTESNTITTLETTLPTKATSIASAVIGTKVYLFGGYYRSGSSNNRLNTINVFDTESNTITTIGTLPTNTYGIASAVVGTKVYLFGGQSQITNETILNTISVFDVKSNTITTLETTLPTQTYDIASAVVGTKVYLFGGFNSIATNGMINTINVFDTESDTITTLSETLPSTAGNIASAVVGTKVYLFGGQSYISGTVGLNAINVFVVLMKLATNNLLIEVAAAKNIFNLLPTVELGVNAVYLGNADGYGEKVAAALYKDGAWADI